MSFPFHGVEVTFGTEQLFFQCTVQRVFTDVIADDPSTPYVDESTDVILRTDLAQPQTASDASAISANPNLGVRQNSITGLLLAADHACLNMAEYLVDRYSSAEAVVSALTVVLNGLSTADRASVTALDITDIISLTWTPANTGSQVTQTLMIEGVQYRNDVGGIAAVSFDLSEAQSDQVFTLDSSSLAVLDTSALAY